ncbi:hypothetical protein BO70DRAFT_432419 [Aspergillus heteromorphus CBS 117.55]|uniref:Lysine-specific metallo-endopeptidase domain-containing protein n=1 Tax=Aspergillus heteromorphus CBS 117.55 TaxID=1448321 RepID=A0A317V643_9EURO|nr:uncharacterized protein BO70DRAFT_432419 [Aspergillus heteromorphus CBS 117.55]PWY69773.1 hypothetical protein BO70DRAFT_432419 [Aspergillus heteromorphus CBS 117.55]
MASLFDVVTSTTINGNCAQYTSKLDQLVTDALKLAKAGVQACDDYQKADPVAERLLDAFFQKPTTADVQSAKSWYEYLEYWLENGGPLTGRTQKPLLFCEDHSQRVTMSTPMRDAQGQINPNPNGKGSYLIKDDPKMVAWQKSIATSLQVAVSDVYPYWDKTQLLYWMDEAKGTALQYQCAQNSLGYTNSQASERGAVTLCPSSFAPGTLGSVAPVPVTLASYKANNNYPPTPNQPINDIMPAAATFFHELLHLFTDMGFVPSVGEEYNAWAIMGTMARANNQPLFTGSDSISNAESYTFVAGAAWYAQNMPYNGQVVEYYTGWATVP